MQFRFHWLLLSLVVSQLGTTHSAAATITSLRPDDSLDGYTTSTSPTLDDTNPASNEEGQWGFTSSSDQADLGSASLDPNDDTSNLAGQVWVSRNEDAPQLTTTLSGLDTDGLYSIYLYHVPRTSPWGLFAHIDGVTTSQFFGFEDGFEIEEVGPAQSLERVLLGTVSGTSRVDIIVDDDPTGQSAVRGFYKGVGVALVPEPASIVSLALVGLAMIVGRRT